MARINMNILDNLKEDYSSLDSYSDDEASEIVRAYFDKEPGADEDLAMELISKFVLDDRYPKLHKEIKQGLKKEQAERNKNDYEMGTVEHTIQNVANEMSVNFANKTPFDEFYAPDSDDEDEEEYWYNANYDYATFYDKILHDLGYGENPVLNDLRAEVHEVSDGKYVMNVVAKDGEHSVDLRCGDNIDDVKENVEFLVGLFDKEDLKESADTTIKLTKETRDQVEVGDILSDSSNRYVVTNVIEGSNQNSKSITVRDEKDWRPIFADPISNWYGTTIVKGPFIRKDDKVIKESTDYLLDRNYPDIMKELRNIVSMFGIDPNIFNEKLDNSEVTQTEFDSALNMLIDATGRTTEFSKEEINKMKETTDDLIYTYTESYLNDMWNEEPDPNVSDEEMNKIEEEIRRFSDGVTQYLKDEIEFI